MLLDAVNRKMIKSAGWTNKPGLGITSRGERKHKYTVCEEICSERYIPGAIAGRGYRWGELINILYVKRYVLNVIYRVPLLEGVIDGDST